MFAVLTFPFARSALEAVTSGQNILPHRKAGVLNCIRLDLL